MALDAYRKKRSPNRTPEPFGGTNVMRPGLFVVQKHAARRMHYDLRLEVGGVLRSWAVPKGPSSDPAEKRLAVEVEDHPVEYADFEGVIPKDNYGAGTVIVWDRGRYVPREDFVAGFAKGKLLFELFGHKLRGVFTLVRTKRNPKEWLLIKERDPFAGLGPYSEESIFSGFTVDELSRAPERNGAVISRLRELGAPERPVRLDVVTPMLAETADAPFSDEAFLFELKYDGFRLLAGRQQGRCALRYRSGQVATSSFPDIVAPLKALPYPTLVLDGEVVVLDNEGRPSFQLLQQRVNLEHHADIERASVELPATYFVFDLLGFDELDLRPLPLSERKALLKSLLPKSGPIQYADHVEGRGEALYQQARKRQLEGVMAKRKDSPYAAGRHPAWLKVRGELVNDFAVVGYTLPKGTRKGLGSLHLALFDGERFIYAGRAGSGLSGRELVDARKALDAELLPKPVCVGQLPRGREHRWVTPTLVAEVRYHQWTFDGHLRQPSFLRFRDDKSPEDCRLSGAPPPPEPADAARKLTLSNLDKVFWPKDGITKGDLIEYYRRISPWLLPYLANRPLVMTRYPDGTEGKSFYQKDAPVFAPSWMKTVSIYAEQVSREIQYFVCNDLDSLLYVVNLATIPLHLWPSREGDLAHPDWCILDLDPKGAPFAHVVTLARSIRELCEGIGLDTYVKTSGSTGLHILVPLGCQCTFDQSRTLAELIARVMVERHPAIATVVRQVGAREGKVYIDYLQNRHGQLLVAPFSARPLPGAPVSMPLRWSQVTLKLRPDQFTLTNAARHIERVGEDPMRPVLSGRPNLKTALDRLGALKRAGLLVR